MKYLLLFIISISVFGDIIDYRQYSEKYYAGSYLIYDCRDLHWVCADEASNKKCVKKRKLDILKEMPVLSCIPVKKFKTIKGCIRKKQTVVNNPVNNLLCQHPSRLRKPFISL
jgi:hypothetical protein